MGELQKFTRRHYFQFNDNRRYITKWNDMRKKRMWGVRIDVDFNKFHYLIWTYTILHIRSCLAHKGLNSEFSNMELELLVSLVHENRGVTCQDIKEFPLGYGLRRLKKILNKFLDQKILEKFEGHGSGHHRGIVYKITQDARQWISDMNMMQMGFKKIPLSPSSSSEEFVKKMSERTGQYKPNWYANIVKFNEWVDKNKLEYQKDNS